MKKFLKHFVLCALIMVIVPMLVACNNDNTITDTSTHVSTAEQLVNALKTGGEITLDADISLTRDSSLTTDDDEYWLDLEDATAITLNLNSKKLTVTNNYVWFYNGITIKNGEIEAVKGSNYAYAVCVSSGTATLESVTIKGSIQVESATSVSLNNVTLDAQNTPYCVAINATGSGGEDTGSGCDNFVITNSTFSNWTTYTFYIGNNSSVKIDDISSYNTNKPTALTTISAV